MTFSRALAWTLWATVLGYMVWQQNWNVVAIFALSFILIHLFIWKKPL
jgi:hypothetical protein